MNGAALMWIKIFLILLFTTQVLSCFGWGSYNAPSPKKTITTTQKVKRTEKIRNVHGINIDPKHDFGGWTPSPDTEKRWKMWLDEYYNETIAYEHMTPEERQKEIEKLKKKRGGWPEAWKNLGPSEGGDDPPPWSYIPKNIGLPEYCLQFPEPGNCSEKLTRWGYSPFDNQCREFLYTGCGGNQNNYKEKLRCEQACMISPVSGCDTDSHIPIDHDYRSFLDYK